MIMMDDDSDNRSMGRPTTDVVVVGAGIAGLTAALAAAKAGARVRVFDAHDAGGRARTADQHGWQHNIGPHALYNSGRLSAVLAHHGLTLPGGEVDGRVVRMLRAGTLHRVRVTPLGLARAAVLGRRSRVRLLTIFAKIPKLDPSTMSGTSVAAWLGDEPDDVRDFIESFIRLSSYTHAADVFDAGAAISQLQTAFQGVRYLDGGWMRIIEALIGRARQLGVHIEQHREVRNVHADGERAIITVGLRNGDEHCFPTGSVIIAAGGPDLVERMTGGSVADRGSLTPPIRATSLDLATRTPHDCFSLGLDQPLYLSPHAPTAKLAPAGHGLVCAMRYLCPDERSPDPASARAELRELARVAGIDDDHVVHERFLLQSMVAHGAPTSAGGGLGGRPRIDALGIDSVLIAGDWVGAEGLLADASAASGTAAGAAAARRCASFVA